MAIAPSVLASVSGLNLLVAEFIFPDGLIFLQPLLVFLLSRRFFADERAAALSVFLVTITSALSQSTGGPLAESTALSLLMLFLLLLCILLMLYLKARPTVVRTEGIVSLAELGVLGLSIVANVVAPGLVIDRYAGLMGWLILSISGGRAMRFLTRTSRQLAALMPLVFLIALSAVVYPPVSPQYGLGVPVDLRQLKPTGWRWIGLLLMRFPV